ncbi:MAG: tetratricopeptide repeat protein [Phycisphaerae bacterium]
MIESSRTTEVFRVLWVTAVGIIPAGRGRRLAFMWLLLAPVVAWGQDPAGDETGASAPDAKPSEPVAEQVVMTPAMAVRDAQNALDRAEADVTDRPISELLAIAANRVDFLKRNDPINPTLPLLSGRLLAAAGRHREAVAELQKYVASRAGRNHWRAYQRLGDLLVDDYPRLAKGNYDKADALKPGVIEVRYGLARCAAAFGKTRDAIRLGRQVVEQDGYKSAGYLAFFAQALFAGEQWMEAEQIAAQAVDKMTQMVRDHPGAMEPLIALDAVYSLLVQTVRTRMAVSEPSGEDYIRLAHYVRDQIENKAHISMFEVLRVLEGGAARFADEPSLPLLLEYAVMLDQVGRREMAEAVFQRVVELDSENAEARAWLAQYAGSEPTVEEEAPRP